MMKKGQTQQIFTWIFILILAVSILFFGIKIIKQGEGLKNEVLLVDFFNKLDKRISDFYFLDFDSSDTEEFILPLGVKEVCFINLGASLSSTRPDEDYMKSLNAYSNVFIITDEEFTETRTKIVLDEETNENIFFVGADSNSGDIVCPGIRGGRVSIKFINKGNKGVKIEDPNP